MVSGRVLWVTTALSTIALSGTAFAQSTPKTASNSPPTVGEVVVTAQKRSEALQQVPVAISAYTSTDRDKKGIDTVQDMTNFTPGLVYNTGDDRVSMRGIGRYTNQLSADSSVGVYEDGAFTTFTTKVGEDSLFVDRIEVLRGPQGTLYGRNSIGGAINVISRQPTDELYAEVRGTVDNYGYHVEEGAVSGPITDHLQYRLAAAKTDQEGGYFNNLNGNPDEGNRRNEYYVEGQLRGDFGPHFDWWFKAYIGGWHNRGGNAGGRISNQVIVGPDGKTAVANPIFPCNGGLETTDALVPSLGANNCPGVTGVVTVNPSGLNPGNFNIRDFYSLYPQSQNVTAYYGATLRLTGHFSGFDVRYLGSLQRYTYNEHEEWGEGFQLASGVVSYVNPTGVRIFPDSQLLYGEDHWFSQNEIDVLSTSSGPLQWVAGIYNFNEGYKQPEEINLQGQAQLDTPISSDTGKVVPNPHRDVYNTLASMGAETFAGFGQLDYNVTSTFKATAGIRYSYDAKWGLDSAQFYEFLPLYGSPLPIAITGISRAATSSVNVSKAYRGASPARLDPTNGLYVRNLGANWGGVTGVAGLQWQPDRDTNIYLKYSRGYKSGGFNAGSGLVPNPETAPEHANDYQFGIKKTFNRTLQVNLDFFYDQYYDAQLPIYTQNGGVLVQQFYNIPESRTAGVEIEAEWQPIRPLQLMLSYGFDDTSIVNSGCLVDPNDPTATGLGATPGGCTGGAQNLKGDVLPDAPRNKVAVNATYTWDLPSGGLSLSGSYIWRDKQYGTVFTRPFYEAPSWDQVDLRLEYRPNGGHWTLIAYGKNIFNTTGYIAGAQAAIQSNGDYIKSYSLTPPAIGGIEVQYKF